MARYIDEKDVYKLVEPTGTARVHCSQIDALPRADVAPKSETAREIFEEIDIIREETTGGNIMRLTFFHRLAELKKKYIGEDTNVPTESEVDSCPHSMT